MTYIIVSYLSRLLINGICELNELLKRNRIAIGVEHWIHQQIIVHIEQSNLCLYFVLLK